MCKCRYSDHCDDKLKTCILYTICLLIYILRLYKHIIQYTCKPMTTCCYMYPHLYVLYELYHAV